MTLRQRNSRRGLAIALSLPLLLGAGIGGYFAARYGQGEAETLKRVGRPSSKIERAAGIVRGKARVEAQGPNPVPACLGRYKDGKSRRTVHVNGNLVVRFDDGTSYAIPETTNVHFFQNYEPRDLGITSEDRRRVLVRLGELRPAVKKWELSCLGPKEAAWVEGCVHQQTELRGCGESPHVLLTPGGPRLRLEWAASHAAGGFALSLVCAMVALFALRLFFVHQRSSIASLARDVRPISTGAQVLFGLGLVGSVIGFGLFPTVYGPWLFVPCVAVVAVFFALALVTRMRVLSSARRLVASTETTRLHDASNADHELAVQVAPDAPRVEGFREGDTHAFVKFTIQERYAKRSNNKTVIATKPLLRGFHPKQVPIVDASGSGLLDPSRCELDVPPERSIEFTGRLFYHPPWLTTNLELSESHRALIVEWHTVDPGEPLLLYGGVERMLPSGVGTGPSDYRSPATVPVVRGRENDKVVAYVGSERALLRGIRIEQVVSAMVLVLLLGAIGATVAAMVATFS